MAINWQDPEVKDRLLAAIIASYPGNVNCTEVARIFGLGATYNSIENFLRKPKKLAQRLQKEAAQRAGNEACVAASPTRGGNNTREKGSVSPVKSGVKSGRVTKAPKISPVKKGKMDDKIKKEIGINEDGGEEGDMGIGYAGDANGGVGGTQAEEENDNVI